MPQWSAPRLEDLQSTSWCRAPTFHGNVALHTTLIKILRSTSVQTGISQMQMRLSRWTGCSPRQAAVVSREHRRYPGKTPYRYLRRGLIRRPIQRGFFLLGARCRCLD